MPSYLDFPAAGLANLGSSVFKGLLEGREIVNEEQKQRRLEAHQGFLDRLAAERLRIEQGREQRLGEYLNRPTFFGNRVLQRTPTGQYNLMDLPPAPLSPETADLRRAQREHLDAQTRSLSQPKGPTDPIKQLEADIVDAERKGDKARALASETLLKRLRSASAPVGTPHTSIHYEKDAQGNITEIATTVRPDGTISRTTTPLGGIGTGKTEKEGKLIGETSRAWMNKNGETAPPEMPVKDAAKAGYFQASPKEEGIVLQLPQSLTMLSNLVETSKKLRDQGGFRTAGGILGLGQRAMIAGKQSMGDPSGVGGLLNLWAGQKSELISLYRSLGEKGNIAAKVLVPQLDALKPGAGFPAIIQMLKYMEGQLQATANQSRVAGIVPSLPKVPDLLSTSDQRYVKARMSGLSDQAIEQKFGVIVVPETR